MKNVVELNNKLSCVVTSNSPEMFININEVVSEFSKDVKTNYCELIVTSNVDADTVFINSVHCLTGSDSVYNKFTIDNYENDKGNDNLFYHIFIDSDSDMEFTFDIICKFKSIPDKDGNSTYSNVIKITDNKLVYKSSVINAGDNKYTGNPISDNTNSFMVLRTNPKMTGNVKLVVDSKNKVYLDTFKVSSILANRQYRKQEISGNSTLSNDIHNVFSGIPKGELYKVNPENYSMHNIYTDYGKMYDQTYNYGTSNNLDELYTEDFKILAPLWLGKKLPDFFAVFRVPESVYNSDVNAEGTDVFKSYLQKGRLIKTFDMRESSVLGLYLRNHIEDNNYTPGPVYLQFKEQELKESIIQGENTWSGISVDSGLLVSKKETTYQQNKILNDASGTQEMLNQYLSNGFERNNLLSANLINLEFMFNDETSELYKMHRYFGVYLTENEFMRYRFITMDNKGVVKYDKDGNKIKDDFFFANNKLLENELSDRLVFATSTDSVARIKNKSDILSFITDNVLNKPNKNILNAFISKEYSSKEIFEEFLTLNFQDTIQAGEHLRFIIPNYTYTVSKGPGYNIVNSEGVVEQEYEKVTKPLILELVASNDVRLKFSENYIGRVNYNKPDNKFYQYDLDETSADLVYDRVNTPIIYRIPFYVNTVESGSYYENRENYNSITDTEEYLPQIIQRIVSAINVFKEMGFGLDVIKEDINGGSIAITSTHKDTLFQRVSACTYNKEKDNTKLNNQIDTINNSILPFGNKSIKLRPTYFNLDDLETFTSKSGNTVFQYLLPDGFENMGGRWQYTTNFAKFNNLYEIDIDELSNIDYITLYETTNYFYKRIDQFTLTSYEQIVEDNKIDNVTNDVSVNIIQSPFNLDKYVIDVEEKANIVNNMINLYSTKHLSLSLMGMTNIKDFHYIDYDDINYNLSERDLITLKVPKGETIVISNDDNDNPYRLYTNGVYRLTKGSFYNVEFKDSDRVFTTFKDGDVSVHNSINIDKTFELIASSDCEITMYRNMVNYIKDDIVFKIKKHDLNKFIIDKVNGLLSTPYTTPTVSYWEMVGTNEYNINAPLLADKIKSKVDIANRSIGISSFNYIGKSDMPVVSSINNTVKIGDNVLSFKDYILSDADNTIDRLVGTHGIPHTSIGYYNKNTESFEFILSGIKFNLVLNASQKNNNIDLSIYNNYKVYLMNTVCDNKTDNSDFDMIIKTDEKSILIINYKFDLMNNAFKKSLFSDFKTNYVYKNTNFYFDLASTTFNKDCTNIKYFNGMPQIFDTDIKGTYAQFNTLTNEDMLINTKINNGVYINLDSLLNDDLISIDKDNKLFKLYTNIEKISILNNFYNVDGERNGSVFERSSIYMPNDKEYDKSLTYFILSDTYYKTLMEKDLDNKPYTEEDLRYNVSNKNVTVYIKSGKDLSIVKMDDRIRDVLVTIDYPENTGYNYGYFTPRFINKFDFYKSDKEVEDVVNVNFDYCNTKFNKCDTINIFYNKIFNNNKHNIKNGSSLARRDNFNLFSSIWDSGYFRLYISLDKYINVNGYEPGKEDKAFFGSKGLVTYNKVQGGNEILLDNWDTPNLIDINTTKVGEYNTTRRAVGDGELIIKFNLTLALVNYFMTNPSFVANWKSFNYDNTFINNYIINSVLRLYKIGDKTKLNLYYKPDTTGEVFQYERPSDLDFENEYDKVTNLESEIVFENNNYYAKIKLSNHANKKFYATFTVDKNIKL